MTRQAISVGGAPNDGTGDPLRVAFDKTNDNFEELYSLQSLTINAGGMPGATDVEKIQSAINLAVGIGADRVFVPASMLLYDATQITFSTAVQMVREGGSYDVYDVTAYGANGNDAVLNSVAFQATADGAASTGGTMWVPQGTFRTGFFRLNNNTTLRGESWRSVIKVPAGNTDPLLIGFTNESLPTPNTNVSIENLTLDGNYANATGGPQFLIYANAVTYLSVRNCWIKNFRSWGVLIRDNGINPITDLANYAGSADCWVTDNLIEGRSGAIAPTSESGILVSSQLNVTSYPYPYVDYPGVTRRITVKDNVVRGSMYGINLFNAPYCTVQGNKCYDQGARNIFVGNGSHYSTIATNTCELAPGSNIALGGDFIAVTGNVCKDCQPNGANGGEGRAINAQSDWDFLTITGNTIDNPSISGISLSYGIQHSTVAGNVVVNGDNTGIEITQGRPLGTMPTDRSNRGIAVTGNVVENTPTAFAISPNAHATATRATDISLVGNIVGPGCTTALYMVDVDYPTFEGNNWAGKAVAVFGTITLPTFTSLDTFPSVHRGERYQTANAGATTITGFGNYTPGQEITILLDGNTTIQHNAGMKLAGGVNFVGTANDTIRLMNRGGTWYEVGRSVNG